jgi:hypothetical protein
VTNPKFIVRQVIIKNRSAGDWLQPKKLNYSEWIIWGDNDELINQLLLKMCGFDE